jgi:hypothetical protein
MIVQSGPDIPHVVVASWEISSGPDPIMADRTAHPVDSVAIELRAPDLHSMDEDCFE